MLKKLLIAFLVLVVALVIVVSMRPADFRVTRTTTFNAPAAAVFAQVNDLHNWQAWSPWAKLDPAAKLKFDGPPAGVGAAFSWVGNSEVGEGRMTITQSRPNEFVQYRLDFVKPLAATSNSEFTLKPDGEKTAVTWTMYGQNNFLAKAISLCIDCDKMIGGDFEKGFANLKPIVEKK